MSKKLYVNEIDCSNSQEIIREFNNEEYAAHQIRIEQEEILRLQTEAKAQAKAQLLAQLGITEEQAKLLLS